MGLSLFISVVLGFCLGFKLSFWCIVGFFFSIKVCVRFSLGVSFLSFFVYYLSLFKLGCGFFYLECCFVLELNVCLDLSICLVVFVYYLILIFKILGFSGF